MLTHHYFLRAQVNVTWRGEGRGVETGGGGLSGHIGRRRLARKTVLDARSNSIPSKKLRDLDYDCENFTANSLQSDIKEVKMDQ